jgi:ribosome recycling factor
METLKKLEKEKKISEDDHKKKADEVQKMTDETIKKIDKIFADKEKDIMTV